MKTIRTIIFIMVAIGIHNITIAQLRIDSTGKIGFGMQPDQYPNSQYKVHIKGNLLLTTYPEIPIPMTNFVEFGFKVGNGWPGAEFGSSLGKVAVWNTSYPGYNHLYAQAFWSMSDSTYKTNIQPLEDGLTKILQLSTYTFQFKRDSIVDRKLTYGFLSQQVQNVLPDDVETMKNAILMDYDQIIPLTVRAIQQQKITIDSLSAEIDSLINSLNNNQKSLKKGTVSSDSKFDSLQNEIMELKNEISLCCNRQESDNLWLREHYNLANAVLYQNNPNPYSYKTDIRFEINTNYTSAFIVIFNMQGALIKSISINQKGKGQITINGYELQAGMYLYSLLIDNKEIDTKRMILLK